MPDKDSKIEDYSRVLVVEGHSDLLFYAEVLESLGLHGTIFIKTLGGKTEDSKLETLFSPGLIASKTHIACIFDADGNPQTTSTRFSTLLSRLTRQAVTESAWTAGPPKIGLLVVPGGNRPGEIETLVWNSWANDPANEQQRDCITNYVQCMTRAGRTAHSPDKGLIGALLAIRSDEDPRLGPGARDNVFDLGRPELTPLRTFLAGFQ